ncbi:hypothetical protein ACFL6D_04915 [Spirochaetota bacterium]
MKMQEKCRHGGGELTEILKAWVHYSYVGGEQHEKPTKTSGKEFTIYYLANQAPHTVKGGIDIHIVKIITVTPSATWYCLYKTRPDNQEYAGEDMDGHLLVNLSASVEIANFRIWGLVENLLNQAYYTPAGIGSSLDPAKQPQELLSFQIGASARF